MNQNNEQTIFVSRKKKRNKKKKTTSDAQQENLQKQEKRTEIQMIPKFKTFFQLMSNYYGSEVKIVRNSDAPITNEEDRYLAVLEQRRCQTEEMLRQVIE